MTARPARRYKTTRLTTTFGGVLPRSLAPWPDESLVGYLLRLSARLGRQPIDVAQLCGLAGTNGRDLPGLRALSLPPDRLAAFAAATRMSEHEARALTLERFLGGALPAPTDDGDVGPSRVRAHWGIHVGRTRACPDCMTGPDARWRSTWQLSWHFVCLDHQRLLVDACPACRTPYGRDRPDGLKGQLLAAQSTAGMPLNACRATGSTGLHSKHDPIPRCGHLLGSAQTLAASPPVTDRSVLTAQRRFLDAAAQDPSSRLPLAGAPLPLADWFEAVRSLAGLVRLAAAPSPVPLPDALAAALDRLAADRAAAPGIDAASALLSYGAPPRDAAEQAALAVQALDLADAPDWDALVHRTAVLRQLAADRAPVLARRLRPVLSPVASRLVRGETSDGLLNTWLVLAPPPYRKDWDFDARHVPLRLDDELWNRHFLPFAGIQPVLRPTRVDGPLRIRRSVPVALVQMAHQCSQRQALALLGMPGGDALTKYFAALDQALARTGTAAAFRDALHGAAADIQAARTDHGALRDALRDWTIPAADWATLAPALQRLQHPGPPVDWDRRRRLSTSAVVWQHITGGDLAHAPAHDHPDALERRRRNIYAWKYQARLQTGAIPGMDTVIVPYADRLARTILDRAAAS